MRAMRVLFDDTIYVSYGQMYVVSDGIGPAADLHATMSGQDNGLCGALTPGFLWLNTGSRYGDVRVRVELHDAEPPMDDAWEEIVEASFTPASADVDLVQWACEKSWPLAIEPVSHRVRYCGAGLDDAHDGGELDDQPQPDRYLLQFWPAAPQPDRTVKQTSDYAAYWHDTAREL
jgi:hypothetical protein